MNGLRLARIAGIDIHVDWSLLIIFVLITTSLAAGLFPAWHPEWPATTAWGTALAAAVLFFLSVLTHELSHALVGRRNGIVIRRITLFVFGGMAQMEHEPHKWRAELWMAIVGPITSLVLGLLFLYAVGLTAGPVEARGPVSTETAQQMLSQLGPLPTLLLWLGQVNVILAIFNMVPGFPLDGGRVLRAILWGMTGNLRRATRWASTLGQAFAWLLIISGVYLLLGGTLPVLGSGPINGLWLAFIGWFLNNAALMSYHQLLTREALQDVPVSRLMLTRFDAVSPDMTVDELIDEYIVRTGLHGFPVVTNDRLVGMVALRDVKKVAREQRASTRVRDIMVPVSEVQTVKPEDEALDVLGALAERDVNQLPVIAEGGGLRGLVRREDIVRWLALHDGGSAGAARA